MMKYILIIFLICASASYAQPPRIDSMLVDESNSELLIFGVFGASQGTVNVDSIKLQIKNWTDSLIIASIPDEGKGSAGPVVVIDGLDIRSNVRMITTWSSHETNVEEHNYSNSTQDADEAQFVLTWRLDIDSKIRNHNLSDINFIGMKGSKTNQQFLHNHVTIETKNDSPYFFRGILSLKQNTVDVNLRLEVTSVGTMFYQPGYKMDAEFNLLSGSADGPNYTWSASWGNSTISFPPPLKNGVIKSNPSSFRLSSFPNPSSKELNISYSQPENGNARIILYDLQGNVIREATNNFGAGEHQIKWDVSQVASGSYVLGLITDKERKAEIVRILH